MVGTLIHRVLLLLFVASVTVTASAVEYKRERYEVIVERSPFGEDPLLAKQAQQDAVNNAKDAAEAAKLAREMEKKIRLCYLLETESGEVRAGFENKAAKAGETKSIMLMVGENHNGMKLSNIDIDNNSATLEMGGKPVTFELTKAAAPVAAKKTPARPTRKFGSGFQKKPVAPTKPAVPELTPEEQAKKREEVRENLRQYQMEVIRQGMPPLPIALTQDMDDQLVAEGILPPGAE